MAIKKVLQKRVYLKREKEMIINKVPQERLFKKEKWGRGMTIKVKIKKARQGSIIKNGEREK